MPVDQQHLFSTLSADGDFALTLKNARLSLSIVEPDRSCHVSADGVGDGAPATPATLRLELDRATADELWSGRLPLMNAVVARRLRIKGPVTRVRQIAELLPAVYRTHAELSADERQSSLKEMITLSLDVAVGA